MPAQRATCEPCRLRRVKCDLRDKLFGCTNCTKRDLQCPGVQVSKTRKPRRGVVVDRVEQEYGFSPSSTTSPIAPSTTPSTPISPLNASANTSTALAPRRFLSHSMVSPTEKELVSIQLRREVNVSMLESFLFSHGKIFQGVFVNLVNFDELTDLGRRLDDLSPEEEVCARVFIALGARTCMHPAILAGADMSYPLTLGIVREHPCKQLAMAAVERYDALGLWRQVTPSAIQVSVMLFFIIRSAFASEFCQPVVNTAVHLMRQYLSTTHLSESETVQFAQDVGILVLWGDARQAAETGTRPLFTQEDLDDNPLIQRELMTPLVPISGPPEEAMGMIHAAMLRLLRSFASNFHRLMRRNSPAALNHLPQLWQDQAALGSTVSYYISACGKDMGQLSQENPTDIMRRFSHVLQINLSVVYIPIAVWGLLRHALEREDGQKYYAAYAEARVKATFELKRVAAHIKWVQSLGEGPQVWVFMSRMFHILENVPEWPMLLALDRNNEMPALLTPEETQLITDGVQQAGWGSSTASQRWLDVLQARGLLAGALDNVVAEGQSERLFEEVSV